MVGRLLLFFYNQVIVDTFWSDNTRCSVPVPVVIVGADVVAITSARTRDKEHATSRDASPGCLIVYLIQSTSVMDRRPQILR